MTRGVKQTDPCSAGNCGKPPMARGLCRAHYARWRRYGDPVAGRRLHRPAGLSIAESFRWYMPGDPPPTGCWDWRGPVDGPTGYGVFSSCASGRPKRFLAHRFSYERFRGEIPRGLWVLHSCDRKICIAPHHLRPGTPSENSQDAMDRDRYYRGIQCHSAKLTDDDVRWIRSTPGLSDVEKARQLGVTPTAVGYARKGRTWKHV